MDPLTLALIGGGVGLLKSELIDRPREKRQRQANAEIARWAPWTGMTPGAVREADPFGSVLQGGLTGAMFSQQFPKEAAATNAATSPQYGLGVSPYQQMQLSEYDPSLFSPYMLLGK